jgi:hypothetical protein
MEGLLLCAGVVALLMGLGALVEAARPRHGGRGRCPVTRTGTPLPFMDQRLPPGELKREGHS